MPRFTLLQLLAAMTICGVLFCIAAIDPIGSLIVLLIMLLCAFVAIAFSAISYLGTRVVSEITFLVFGQPRAASPFGSPPPAPTTAAPTPDLATAVDHLQAETERELGSKVLDFSKDPEEPAS